MNYNLLKKHTTLELKRRVEQEWACDIIPVSHGSQAWKTIRNRNVTASDAAVLLGSSPHTTMLDLYNRKKQAIEMEFNRQMEYGLHMEKLMCEWAAEDLGAEDVVLCNWLLRSQLYEHIYCTLDAIVLKQGRMIPLEGKTLVYMGRDDDDKPYHLHQIQTQLLVTGQPLGYLMILPGGNAKNFSVAEVEEDIVTQARIIEAADDFMACLQTDTPPIAVADDLSSLPFNATAGEAAASDETNNLCIDYANLQAAVKAKSANKAELDKEIKDLKARIAQSLGEHTKCHAFADGKDYIITRSKVEVKATEGYSYFKVDIKQV